MGLLGGGLGVKAPIPSFADQERPQRRYETLCLEALYFSVNSLKCSGIIPSSRARPSYKRGFPQENFFPVEAKVSMSHCNIRGLAKNKHGFHNTQMLPDDFYPFVQYQCDCEHMRSSTKHASIVLTQRNSTFYTNSLYTFGWHVAI